MQSPPPAFAHLFEALGSHCGAVAEWPWPNAFAGAQARGVSHRARRLRLLDVGEIRAVYLASDRVEIYNAFAYPEPSRHAPSLALEFVRFGGKVVVAVIDLPWLEPCAAPAGWTARWRATWDSHAALPPADDPPAWFAECRSGADLFSRPTDPAAPEALVAAHGQAWQGWLEAVHGAAALAPAAASRHAAAQQHYRNHHRAHSPGLPFLQRTFGPEWTASFLREHLFGPSGTAAGPPRGPRAHG